MLALSTIDAILPVRMILVASRAMYASKISLNSPFHEILLIRSKLSETLAILSFSVGTACKMRSTVRDIFYLWTGTKASKTVKNFSAATMRKKSELQP